MFSRFVPSIGSCSQFCLILQAHRVAVPFPPTFDSPWWNSLVQIHGGTTLLKEFFGTTPQKQPKNDLNLGVGSSYGTNKPLLPTPSFPYENAAVSRSLGGFKKKISTKKRLRRKLSRTRNKCRCMFDVILLTHKNMMTISGTRMQGLHSTQVRHHTQIERLTCLVCFVKHMMITTQVCHHTYLDLSTCRVCSVKHMMIMRQYFPDSGTIPTHCMRGSRSLFSIFLQCAGLWSAAKMVVWWLSPKVHCPKIISVTILMNNAWEDTRLIWCLSYISGGAPLIPGHYVSW